MTDAADQARGAAAFGVLDSVVHAVGSTAMAALTLGAPALSGLQLVVMVAALFGSVIPGVGPVIAILAAMIPVLQKIATYAPVVQKAMEDNKAPIETVLAGIPDLTTELRNLYALAMNTDPLHLGFTPAQVTDEMLAEFVTVAKASFFAPQDPRFDRGADAEQR